jgi:hypothetical protein
MAAADERDMSPLKLSEICARIRTSYDDARNALANGLLPKGIEARPGKGRHRVFDGWQAFMLAIALKFKDLGLTLGVVQKVIKFSPEIQAQARELGYQGQFGSFAASLESDVRWELEIADGRLFRMILDPARRSKPTPGRSERKTDGWFDLQSRQPVEASLPLGLVRLNIARLAVLVSTPSL